MKLFMVLIGCKPKGRHTEQHDVFFGIANEIKELVPEMKSFWPEAKNKIHLDGWREVEYVYNQKVTIVLKSDLNQSEQNNAALSSNDVNPKLFFINLGGYKQNDLEEYHYKLIIAANDKSVAIKQAKQTAFFKHTHFAGAASHIDDKYGIDVDDIYELEDILSEEFKSKYAIVLSPCTVTQEDELHIGYFKLDKL